jgi:hypothetical protein
MTKKPKGGRGHPRKGLSLYPLSLETALFAALKTGKPPRKIAAKPVKGKKRNKGQGHKAK